MTEVETIQEFYTALNRNDIAGAVALLHEEIVRVEFEGSPQGGTYRGLAELEAHIARGRGTWAEGGCEPQEFIPAGGKFIVPVHVRVRLKDHSDWLEGDTTDGFALRDGKIIEFHSFEAKEKALAWAGRR